MLLDKRTVGCHHVTTAQRQEAVVIFIAEYVKFYMQAAQWKADLIQQARVDAEAAALADDDDNDVVKQEGNEAGPSGYAGGGTCSITLAPGVMMMMRMKTRRLRLWPRRLWPSRRPRRL